MKILMVCLGNICRSPIAHGVMEALTRKAGLDWKIDSAGTGGWHVGEAPDRRAIAIAKQYGVDIGKQRAQQFKPAHLDEYDHILVMDGANLQHVLAMAKNPEQRARVQLFMGEGEVPDPYYDNQLFEPVYQMVLARCQELLNALAK